MPRAVVVAQLVKRSLFLLQRSTVQIQSSANYIYSTFTVNCIEKMKIKKKEAGISPFRIKKLLIFCRLQLYQ